MNKLTSIRIKQNDGTYSDDIPIQVLAENVSWILGSSISLLDILGDVKYTTKGSIQHQLDTFSLDEVENARVGADDTQYQNLKARLDGEYKDLQDAIAAVAANLQTETGARSNADTAIRTDLSSETTARINGDNLLSSQIIAEVNARQAADTAEATARQNADATLQQNINTEAAARAAGDAAANTRIDNIVAQSGDNITEIVDARTGADSAVYASLKARLDAENSNVKSAINDLNEWDKTSVKARRQARIFTKARLANFVTTGVQYVATSNRACFEFVAPTSDAYFTMPDTVGMRLAKMQSIGGAFVEWVASAYDYGGAKKYLLSSDYSYCCVFLISAGSADITTDQLATINETSIFIGDLTFEELRPTAFLQNILDGTTWTDGYYVYPTTGAITANAAYSITDFIEINQGRNYYTPIISCWYAWYDASKRYMSGGGNNDRTWTRPEVPYYTLTAPTNAKYIKFSLRLGDKAIAILSEHKLSKNKANASITDAVPMSLAVKETPNTLYDYILNTSEPPSMLYHAGTGDWSFTSNGAVGNAITYLTPYDNVSMDKSIIRLLFSATSNFIFSFGYNSAFQGYVTADSGLKVRIDSANSTMAVSRSNWSSTEDVIATISTSALALTSGKIFVIEIEKNTINNTKVRLYDALTPNDVIEVNNEAVIGSGSEYTNQCRCWGVPCLIITSGTITVKRMGMLSTAPAYPSVAVWGDSYIEGYGRNPLCSYANRIKEAIDENIFISGRGGDMASDLLKRFPTELNLCYPKTIILNVGVNDSFNTTASNFFTNLNKLIALAETKNAEIILVTVPHIVSGALNNADFVNEVNPTIRSMGHRYIDIAYAMSTGDGITPDTSKFVADLIHPNISGGEAIFNQIKALMPDLLTQ